ncbi:50S ribosomal protein L17 [Pseudobdellovibrio exovorus]|uniref:Large ribosomal subunit protein bL17 n=1 Tax=Pseudobdellovibrio exovorus JSS TaxID=1184267 RepID=M4V9N1_9BACT|nr:50S ribosomal protein L17 [Pseudobdellovibrio exovorus]AGH96102.1 50S ribosomal protein L17 [Pseudobdellovibrio exovorus JSS]
MASHRRLVKHFSRKSGPRKALLRGLMNSLVEHGRIKTTVARAKEVRRHIEKAVTLGKKGDLNSIRLLVARLANKDAALDIVKNVSPRFKDRNGGYTRVIKIGRRPGDTAEMAFLEFVDYDFKAKAAKPAFKATKEDKVAKKAVSKAKKKTAVAATKAKKTVRKIQSKSRAAMHASR